MVFVRKMDLDYILRLDFLLFFVFFSAKTTLCTHYSYENGWCLVRFYMALRTGFNNNVARKSPFWVSLLQLLFHFDPYPLLCVTIMLKMSSDKWMEKKNQQQQANKRQQHINTCVHINFSLKTSLKIRKLHKWPTAIANLWMCTLTVFSSIFLFYTVFAWTMRFFNTLAHTTTLGGQKYMSVSMRLFDG